MQEPLALDGSSLTLDDVAAVAAGAEVRLAPAAAQRMRATQAAVQRIVRENTVVYGVTTGFGKLSEIAIPPERLAELQVNLVRSHAAGVGAPEGLLAANSIAQATRVVSSVLGAGLGGVLIFASLRMKQPKR